MTLRVKFGINIKNRRQIIYFSKGKARGRSSRFNQRTQFFTPPYSHPLLCDFVVPLTKAIRASEKPKIHQCC
jgi:hypothetical protein